MTEEIRRIAAGRNISIHMPHTWHDTDTRCRSCTRKTFQSTCHIRGMTIRCRVLRAGKIISIHMPHTWHDHQQHALFVVGGISIHMPHTWHDSAALPVCSPTAISIHMPHTWHDRRCARRGRSRPSISIHMPHTWHDQNQSRFLPPAFYFNPHATYVA